MSSHVVIYMLVWHDSPYFHIFNLFMVMTRRFAYVRNWFAILLKHKLFINNIQSMEVNPFIRKLSPFFYRKVFLTVCKW